MAKRETVTFESDLSGESIESGDPTVSFALDGQSYEIDLTSDERAKLGDDLERYLSAARRLTNRGKAIRQTPVAPDAKAIRAWAKSNGHKVPDRGRIPTEVREAFEAAN